MAVMCGVPTLSPLRSAAGDRIAGLWRQAGRANCLVCQTTDCIECGSRSVLAYRSEEERHAQVERSR